MGYLDQDNTYPSLAHTASYTYDPLNRLATAVATGSSTYNLKFVYNTDGSGRYGNMTCQTNGQIHGPCPNWSYNTSTNQINLSGFTYDAAGNMTQDGTGTGTHTYQWDAEGRLSSVDNGPTASFTYNALGQNVQVGSAADAYDFHGRPTVIAHIATNAMNLSRPVGTRHPRSGRVGRQEMESAGEQM